MAKQSQQSKSFLKKLIIYALALPSGWPLLRSPDDPASSCLIPTRGNVQSQRGNLSLLLLCRKLPYEPLADLSSRHMRQNWVPRPPQKHLFRRVTSLWWAETRQEWPLALGIWSPLPPKLCEDKSEALLAVKKKELPWSAPITVFSAWSADAVQGAYAEGLGILPGLSRLSFQLTF